MNQLPQLIPVRMINQFVFCPRLFYMEWVQSEFIDNFYTLDGRFQHRNVDQKSGNRKNSKSEEEKIHAASVELSSAKWGMIARLDLIEGTGSKVVPVDYKRGKLPKNPEHVWDADKAQICAQAMILRDNGYQCDEGVIYYISSNKRVSIPIDKKLVNWTESQVNSLKRAASKNTPPPPLFDSPKCIGCSLSPICLPDEINFINNPDDTGEIRRLYPVRDDAFPLIVDKQGAYVGKSGEEIVVKEKGKKIANARFIDISCVALVGNIQISTQLARELCSRQIPVCYYSYSGWLQGITWGLPHKNVELRILQFKAASNRKKSLQLAKKFMEGKIKNCRTILMRNLNSEGDDEKKALKRILKKIQKANKTDTLLGLEGNAAAKYFSVFDKLLKSNGDNLGFHFHHRNRRPPKDPVNAMLSFSYAMLVREILTTLLYVGFDPYMGFYHQPRYGRPALALDLMEEFRPIICDSVVISSINRKEITPDDFFNTNNSTTLKKEGKKKFIEAFYRRMDTLVTHPVFGYKISYRRVLEVQARLLGRFLSGEIPEYPPFVTR